MKKNLFIILFVSIFCLTACSSNTVVDGKLNINCNGEKTTVDLKEGNTFKCELLNQEYEFIIQSISDNEIIINTPSSGLTPTSENGGISLIGEYNDFTIKKGEETKISTQSTDYQEKLYLYWK